MSKMNSFSGSRPRHTRKDKNHTIIVLQCRALGMVVWDLADIGGKLPDLLCIWRGRCVPVEVKAPGRRDDLTDGERAGRYECRDVGVEWCVAEDLDDVLEAFDTKWRAL